MSPWRLSIRVAADNPLHHLWNNHGVWWIHYSVSSDDGRVRRVRRSLRTHDLQEALHLRDLRLCSRRGVSPAPLRRTRTQQFRDSLHFQPEEA